MTLRNLFPCLVLGGLLAHAMVALADDPAGTTGATSTTTARKQFRQSATYPYIFQPDCYLATTGPAPMRFNAPATVQTRRTPPPLPVVEAGRLQKAKPALVAPLPPIPEPAPVPAPAAAYPPPAVEKTEVESPSNDAVDFSKTPEEVLEYFRNADGKAGKRVYLFDPIFQPVKPTEVPKSKATYVQKP